MGKTTIAYSMCDRLDLPNTFMPLINYFCSRQLDTNNASLIVPTLIYRLASLYQSYALKLVPVLRLKESLLHAAPSLQLEELLAIPWRESSHARKGLRGLRPPIIVIDALDEIAGDGGSVLIQELLRLVKAGDLVGIKFLITSRPQPEIMGACSTISSISIRNLHGMESLEHDVSLYLREALPDVDRLEGGSHALSELARKSDGYFVYASTVVRQVVPKNNRRTARDKLAALSKILTTEGTQLDALYTQILLEAFPRADSDYFEARLNILHVIIAVGGPILVSAIAEFSDTDEDTVFRLVDSLYAVLYYDDGGFAKRVRWHHASFQDYFLRTVEDTAVTKALGFDPRIRVMNDLLDPICRRFEQTAALLILRQNGAPTELLPAIGRTIERRERLIADYAFVKILQALEMTSDERTHALTLTYLAMVTRSILTEDTGSCDDIARSVY